MDLNHRPLPYQGSALTELSYRPSRCADEITAAPASVAVGEGDLDAPDEVCADVVDERAEGRERREEDDVDAADDQGNGHHPAEAEPARDAIVAVVTLDVVQEAA